MITIYDKVTSEPVSQVYISDPILRQNYISQYSTNDFWIYEGEITEYRRWIYDGVILTEHPDWINIKAAIDADKLTHDIELVASEIHTKAEDIFLDNLNTITTSYSGEERESWGDQKADARAYTSDKAINGIDIATTNAQDTLMGRIAASRGIPIDILADGIMQNVAAYEIVFSTALGNKQSIGDQINAILNDVLITDTERYDALMALSATL